MKITAVRGEAGTQRHLKRTVGPPAGADTMACETPTPCPPALLRRATKSTGRNASGRLSRQSLGPRSPLRNVAKPRGRQRGAPRLPSRTTPNRLPGSSPSVPGAPPVSPRNRNWRRSAATARPFGETRFARASILTLPASSAIRQQHGGCWRPATRVPQERP
jgi:hypothetical protein